MSGLGTLTESINNLYFNILSINNGTALRSSINNGTALSINNCTNSALSWSTNSSGSASFPSLNVDGTSSIATNLSIGSSSMRTSTDKLNVSTTSTGPYMFFNDGGTLGTYNTNTSSFPCFIEKSGLGSFPTVNCNNLSAKNTK